MYKHTHIHTYVYIYIYTCIYIYIHTCYLSLPPNPNLVHFTGAYNYPSHPRQGFAHLQCLVDLAVSKWPATEPSLGFDGGFGFRVQGFRGLGFRV